MTTERDQWGPEKSDQGEDGQNRVRRSYNQSNQGSHGNSSSYGNSSNQRSYGNDRSSYGSQGGGYNSNRQSNYNQQGSGGYNNDRQGGGYSRPNSYGSQSGGGYNRDRQSGGGYNNDRQGGGYSRPNSYGSQSGGGYSRPNSYGSQSGGGYNRDRQGGGGYNNDRQGGGYSRPNSYGSQSGGGYNNNYNNRNYNSSPRSDESTGPDGLVKKRRPRVGEAPPARGNSYDNRGGGGRPQLNRSGGGGGRPQFNRSGDYNPNAKYSFQKQLKYREEHFDPEELLRLNKFLANAGVCSRREADEFIQAGVVKVNDKVVSELGTKVKRSDKIMFHDQPVSLEQKVYVLLNKPKNCVTTADDPEARLTVIDLVKNACQERIFPVGRLDRNTTGVLLLTNDGDLASKLTHPKFLKKKIYHVWLDKAVTIADMQKIADGIILEDGEIHADAISYVSDTDKDQVGIEIHSGRNRVVRRMFESLGYHVMRLDRVYFAGLTKKNLKRGQWRYLSEKEVSILRMGAFE